jgi:flagellar motor switch protein FliN/FliY
MATTQTLPPPPPPVAPPHTSEIARQPELEAERALVPSPHTPAEGEGIVLTPALARLPVELDVAVPVRGFRVRNLLALEPGAVIETQWGHGEDMPLAAGAVQLTWCEFEVVETALAVRVTRLV